MFFLPMSPRWLASKGRYDEAKDVLCLIHGRGNRDNPLVIAEFKEVKEAAEAAKQTTLMGLFGKKTWRIAFVGCMTQVWQQLVGGNVMMYYVVYVFLQAGLTGNANLLASSIQYIIFVAMNVPAMFMIDRWGRRNMLICGSILMGFFTFLAGGILAQHGYPVSSVGGDSNVRWSLAGQQGWGKGVIAASYLFVASYGLTWAPVAWVYVSEIFPLEYRAKGVGLSASANWAFNFALALFVPPAFANITWKTYMIFGTFCLASGVHVFFMWPETRRMSLEEIQVLFSGEIPAWRTGQSKSKIDEEIQATSQGSAIQDQRNSVSTMTEQHADPKSDKEEVETVGV